jgi:lipopolysaccharide transport protein LptA
MTSTLSKRTSRQYFCAVLLAVGSLAMPAHAQVTNLNLPISLDADSTDYDGKNSMLMFQGLRLTQGTIGVQADKGLASKLDFEDAVWQFSGNVVIETGNGRIECDSADLKFSGHQLQLATIQGAPAKFELRRDGSEDTTYAEAGRLNYDFTAGVVEFSENAIITEGGNQISSNYLVYNIKEQRINAQSSGDGDPRVKITYTPRATLEIPDGTTGDSTAAPEPDPDPVEPAAADDAPPEPGSEPE